MIKIFKYTDIYDVVRVYVRTNDEQSASARYIIIRERFRCILFALYYFHIKLCQNVEKTTAIHLV